MGQDASTAVGETIETDPNNHTIKYCWDDHQRVVKTVDGRGKTRSDTYTANSDVDSLTSSGAQAWQLKYDGSDRNTKAIAPTASNQPNALQETYGYDPAITDTA